MTDPGFRIGHGYDAHRFSDLPRPLVLGGVTLDHPRGLEGHSDADVLTHAVIDAVLGAAGLGDLGHHFPSSDERWRGSDSLDLLREAVVMAAGTGLRPFQVDCTVIIETPKVAPQIPVMRENLSRVLGVNLERVSIKATTTDGMGFIGREEGAAASAVVMLSAD